jgi:hypothetical protein
MGFFVKQKLKFYRRFKVDIWGILKNSLHVKFKGFLINYHVFCRPLARFFIKNHIAKGFVGKHYAFVKGKIVFKEDSVLRLINEKSVEASLFNALLDKFFNIEPSARSVRVCDYFFHKFLLRMEANKAKDRKFIYDISVHKPVNLEIFLKKEFASLRLVKMYYIILKYRQIQKLAKKAKRMDGLFEANYFYLLECRLPSLMYRSGLIANMFESLNFVKNNNVWVNKIFISNIFYSVKLMTFVGVRILFKGYLF